MVVGSGLAGHAPGYRLGHVRSPGRLTSVCGQPGLPAAIPLDHRSRRGHGGDRESHRPDQPARPVATTLDAHVRPGLAHLANDPPGWLIAVDGTGLDLVQVN